MSKDMNEQQPLSIAEQLARTARLWKKVADRELSPLGLTHPRWTALWKLQRLGDHVSQNKLAESLEIEVASLMRTLAQLEAQSFVVRHCCPHDKRVRIVSLTPDGVQLIKRMEQHIMHIRQSLLINLSDAEVMQLSAVLTQITHNAIEALDQPSIFNTEEK